MQDVDKIVSGIIYGLHAGDGVIRYIGYTQKTAEKRLIGHKSKARTGHKTHRDNWMRKAGVDSIEITTLEAHEDVPLWFLLSREVSCIAQGYEDGLDLTNGTEGGTGGQTFEWTEERKLSLSERMSGVNNHFYGKQHTPEARAKCGAKNIGNKYAEGRVVSEETRRKISEAKMGTPSYNKGKAMSDETKKKLSDAKKEGYASGRIAKPIANIGSHNRWHVGRGIVKEGCSYCVV